MAAKRRGASAKALPSATKVAEAVDVEAVLHQLGEQKPRFLAEVHTAVKEQVSAMTPAEAASVRLLKDGDEVRVIRARWRDPEYYDALQCFLRKKPYGAYEVDSLVTEVVLSATADAISRFYADPATSGLLVEHVVRGVYADAPVRTAVSRELKEQYTFLRSELKDLLGTGVPDKTLALDSATDAVTAIAHTAAAQHAALLASKALATAPAKVLLAKLSVLAANAVASGAVKSAAVVAIKKVGVTVLMKSAIGKLFLAAIFGSSAISIGWLVLPIVAWIAKRSWDSLPKKLAKQLPDEIAKILDEHFVDINREVVKDVLVQICDGLVTMAADHRRATASGRA